MNKKSRWGKLEAAMRVKGEALTDGEMRLYNAVFSRGSVRRYRMKPIPAKLMGEINEYLNSVSMLHADALYRVAVVETPKGLTYIRHIRSRHQRGTGLKGPGRSVSMNGCILIFL